MTEPTDTEIVALADATRTAEGSANGYILPISFARAVLAKWGTPSGAVPLTARQIDSLLWKYGYDPDDEHMAEMLKEARGIGIKGG